MIWETADERCDDEPARARGESPDADPLRSIIHLGGALLEQNDEE
jgi:hypothetical protein